jgi:hypothetical protein
VSAIVTSANTGLALFVERQVERLADNTHDAGHQKDASNGYDKLHQAALSSNAVLVVSATTRRMGSKEYVLVPVMAKDADSGQATRRVYWGYDLLPALVVAHDKLLRSKKLRLVLDLDGTVVDSITFPDLMHKIARRDAALRARPRDARDLDMKLWAAEKVLMEEDMEKFKQFRAGGAVIHKGKEYHPVMEKSKDASGKTIEKSMVRIVPGHGHGSIFFTCTDPDEPELTAIMIRVRPQWDVLCQYVLGRVEVSVASAGDLPYVWEVWRLLDPETAPGTYLIQPGDRQARVLSVKAEQLPAREGEAGAAPLQSVIHKKQVLHALGLGALEPPGARSGMAAPTDVALLLILDDLVGVWEPAAWNNVLKVVPLAYYRNAALLLVCPTDAGQAHAAFAEVTRWVEVMRILRSRVLTDGVQGPLMALATQIRANGISTAAAGVDHPPCTPELRVAGNRELLWALRHQAPFAVSATLAHDVHVSRPPSLEFGCSAPNFPAPSPASRQQPSPGASANRPQNSAPPPAVPTAYATGRRTPQERERPAPQVGSLCE